jgi:hypothetical protein
VLEIEAGGNPSLLGNWTLAKAWEESSRYVQKTQQEAQSLYDAIANEPDGVLPWIRKRW